MNMSGYQTYSPTVTGPSTTVGTMLDGNTTAHLPRTCDPNKFPEHIRVSFLSTVSLLSIVFVFAMFGNLCVLVAVWRRRAKSTRMHLFIVHLAVADIVVALFQVLPELLTRLFCGFHGGDAACRFIRFAEIVGMYGSTYVLVCTAMDRYFAIKYPMQTFKQSKTRVHVTIALAWLFSLILSTPQFFFFGIVDERPVCRMYNMNPTAQRIYVTWYFISILAFPVSMLTYFYGMIAYIIFKNLKQKRQAAAPNRAVTKPGHGDFAPRASNVKIVSRAKLKTVKMTFVIVILFALCYIPFFMFQLLGVWGAINRNSTVSEVFHVLAALNSCVNPWVYMGFSGHLLGELKQAFTCGRKTKQTQPPRSFRSTMATNLGGSSFTGGSELLTNLTAETQT